MSDIRQWLDDQGLGQYADAFDENEIGLDMLSRLTDAALEKLGVEAMGHRIRILDAIAALTDDDRLPENQTALEAASAGSVNVVAPEAERRQITVMFCDLVGSTALSEKLDPEDLRDLMAMYQKTAGEVVGRYEGHVAQYLGDGLMVYFGWPVAHEEDAGRAVRTGLELVEAVTGIEGTEPLHVRIGIATGPVVVGETGAGDASVPKAAVGETPNVAARLQGLAGSDEIVISPITRQLAGGAFEYGDLGEHDLKGISEPLRAWKVLNKSAVDGRFEAQTSGGLTPLVGRDSEIALLLGRWAEAKGGGGQVVLLSGEPGIGKSRIALALREQVASEPHTRLRYQCSPFYTNTAFYPVIDQLERAAGFARDDPPDTKLDKLEVLIAQGTDQIDVAAPLVAALLSLPVDRYAAVDLSPPLQKKKTIEVLAEQAAGLARQNPVLMIFEDVHWADATTLDVIGAVIDRIRDVPALMVVTHRHEFEPPWGDYSHVTLLSLNRLTRRQGAR